MVPEYFLATVLILWSELFVIIQVRLCRAARRICLARSMAGESKGYSDFHATDSDLPHLMLRDSRERLRGGIVRVRKELKIATELTIMYAFAVGYPDRDLAASKLRVRAVRSRSKVMFLDG